MAKPPKLSEEQWTRLLKIAEREHRREVTWARRKTWAWLQFARAKIWFTAMVMGAGGTLTLYDFCRVMFGLWHNGGGGN